MRRWIWLFLSLVLACGGCGTVRESEPEQEPPPAVQAETPAQNTDAPPEDAPETEDHVLLTLNTEVNGGRVLTLEAIGKKRADMDQWGVREVRVYDGDTLLQTLSMQEAIDRDGVSGALGDGYTDCWEPEGSLSKQDMNFDGFSDICLQAWIPAGPNVPYYYWLWDPDAEAFRYGFCLAEAVPDPETRQIICDLSNTDGYTQEYYTYDAQGDLRLAYSVTEHYAPDGTSRREVWRQVDGTLVREE